MSSPSWTVITGEYPPQPGGVSDYTAALARALIKAGDNVEVWAPPVADEMHATQPGISVHRLPDRFGKQSRRILTEGIHRAPVLTRLLVQYVPQAFGRKGMNLAFCFWIWKNRKRCEIHVMFHEVATPWGKDFSAKQLTHHMLAIITRIMAFLVARSAAHIYVSIPAWKKMLYKLAGTRQMRWLPVPSAIPTEVNGARVAKVRQELLAKTGDPSFLIGHFGTFGGHIAEGLRIVIPKLLAEQQAVSVILVGRGSQEFLDSLRHHNTNLGNRVLATGHVESNDVSEHLAACDLLIQPYIDGISGRRTSAMAGLALGVPIVTTSGFLSEALWRERNAVRLANSFEEMANEVKLLLSDAAERSRLGAAGQTLYSERFQITHTIEKLRHDSGIAPLLRDQREKP